MSKKKKLYISPSGISSFFSCPAQFYFRQNWKVRYPKDNLGSIVHRALEQDKPPEDKEARKLYSRLKELIRVRQIKILGREIREQFEWSADILFTRIFDVIGKQAGKIVLVDYKTANRPWETVEGIYPQTRGIQAASYLYNPGKEIECSSNRDIPEYNQPSQLFFLVASKYGAPQFVECSRKKEDKKILSDAISIVYFAWKNNLFPRVSSKLCGWCDYAGLCHKSCGWREQYEPRSDHADIETKTD